MSTCGGSERQEWVFQSWKGDPMHTRLKTMGSDSCLDVINDGRNNQVKMVPCANVAGQAWMSNLPNDMKF